MKSAIKWIIIIITCVIFLYGFNSSYSAQNIDNLDYVIAIGVDVSSDSNNLEISFEFADISSFSEDSSSSDSEPIINTVETPSISTALNLMNAYAGKHLNLSHCKVIVFSEELAKQGILTEVTTLMNNTQIRPSTNIIISKGNSKEYLENSISSLEQVLTKYYDIFPSSSEYTGYTSNITLSDFYEGLQNEDCGTVAILGEISESPEGENSSSSDNSTSTTSQSDSDTSSQNTANESSTSESSNEALSDVSISSDETIVEGDRGTENIGLCVFKDDVHVGDLTSLETLCYSLIQDEVDSFSVSIDDPFNDGEKIDVSVNTLSTTDIDVDVSGDNPVINIKLNFSAQGLSGQENLNFSDTETLKKLDESLQNYLSSLMTDYLYKTSKEYKSDINQFYRSAKCKFMTISELQDYNWGLKYENAEFNVEINSDIISSLLVPNSNS